MTAVLNGASLPLPENPPEIAIDRRAVERVAQLLSVAKKPILYVGQGANEVRPPPAARRRPPAAARRRPPARRSPRPRPQAREELAELAEAANVPVTTTLHAMGASTRPTCTRCHARMAPRTPTSRSRKVT